MAKLFFTFLVILFLTTSVLYSREIVGVFSTDIVIVEYPVMSRPIMSTNPPKVNVPVKLITFPNEVVSFLEREGVPREEMEGKFMTVALADKICSICEGQQSEFCSIMCGIVADFRNPQYEAYVVKVGSVYWTVYT